MTRLRQALTERILVLDGAMGTMLQAANLSAADFGGPALEGCNEHLNLTRPDVIRGIHAAYFKKRWKSSWPAPPRIPTNRP